MERCACVEREVDKVLQKFLCYGQHCERGLEELLRYVSQLREELGAAGRDASAWRQGGRFAFPESTWKGKGVWIVVSALEISPFHLVIN